MCSCTCTSVKMSPQDVIGLCTLAIDSVNQSKELRCDLWIQDQINSERRWYGWIPFYKVRTYEEWREVLGHDVKLPGHRPVCHWGYPDFEYNYLRKDFECLLRMAMATTEQMWVGRECYDKLMLWSSGG